MDVISVIKERRSVREFKNIVVDRAIMREIVEVSRFSPSWLNLQIARYTLIDNPDTINRISEEGVNGFDYNANILKNAKGVAVISYVKGKSGKLNEDEYGTNKKDSWEMFDVGIACQTFCLAAHDKGVGTVIMGLIDDKTIAEIVGFPDNEKVGAIIVYGYETKRPKPTLRKPVDELLRFV